MTYSNLEGSWLLMSLRGVAQMTSGFIIMIVLEFQVAVVNISEKPQSPNQRRMKMDESVQS